MLITDEKSRFSSYDFTSPFITFSLYVFVRSFENGRMFETSSPISPTAIPAVGVISSVISIASISEQSIAIRFFLFISFVSFSISL